MRHATRVGTVFSLLGALVATSMAMGLLVAGIALPSIGAAGAATNKGIDLFNQMPGSFEMNPLAQESRILAADGSVIATPFNKNRVVVPLSKISKSMQHAQVAIEDERFFQHGAIDGRGLARAITSNVFSNGTQGASTLTQQYVKVAIQDQALNSGNQEAAQRAVSRSGMQGYVRKLQQLKYAVSLEQHYSKDQILDGYFNLVYYGDQQYGIEAAARHYFGVHASQLNLPQSALLAGVVNQPGITDPINNPQAAVQRRNLVLTKMHQQGMISYRQMKKAQNTKLKTHVTQVSSSCAASKDPYFCYYVYSWLLQQPALGKTVKDRDAKLKSGGLTIQTSFNPKLADMMRKKITAKVPEGNDADVQSAGVMVQPGTGLILASAQNTSYSNTGGSGKTSIGYSFPGGGNGGFQFGSTAKMFAIATALRKGHPVTGTIDVPPASGMDADGQFHTFTKKDFPGDCGLSSPYKVHNDFPVPAGPMPYSKALGESINVAFTQLVSDLGACNVRKTMVDLGMKQSSGTPLAKNVSGIVLGADRVAPLTLGNAYATVASGGMYCPPRPVKSIKDSHGKKLKLTGTKCHRVLSKGVAAGINKILKSPFKAHGTAYGDALAGHRQAAGKTGTANGAVQTWFVGSTPQLTTAIWVGHAGDQKLMKNITLGGHFYQGYIFADTIAAPLWKSVMDEALKGKPKKKFPKVPSSVMYGKGQVGIPSVIGKTVSEATSILEKAGFNASVSWTIPSNSMPAGLVVSTSPNGHAKKGTTVEIHASSGAPYTPPPPENTPPPPTSTSPPSSTAPPPTKTSPPPKKTAPPPKQTPPPKKTAPPPKKTAPPPKKGK